MTKYDEKDLISNDYENMKTGDDPSYVPIIRERLNKTEVHELV